MGKDLGDPVGPGHNNERITGDGTASAGDAVAIDQANGKATQGNSGDVDLDQFAGVAEDDFGSDGDGETVATRASNGIVANVAGGVSAGERLGLSATDGQLAESGGGPVLAITDEGGSYKGESLASNEAVVVF